MGFSQNTFVSTAKTIRQNIDPSSSYSQEEIESALYKVADAGTAQQILSMLDATLSECPVSPGWLQRASLARTLLRRQAKLYLFDEPTTG